MNERKLYYPNDALDCADAARSVLGTFLENHCEILEGNEDIVLGVALIALDTVKARLKKGQKT